MDLSLSKLWETAKDREAWWAVIHGVAKSWTRQRLDNNNNPTMASKCSSEESIDEAQFIVILF